MKTYTFRTSAGNLVRVQAQGEPEARRTAMTQVHGPAPQWIGNPPSLIGEGGWQGLGLTLVEEKDNG